MNPFGKIIKVENGFLPVILTRSELEEMTVVTLKNICTNLNIPNITHKKKKVIIDSILKKYKSLNKTKYQLTISEKQARVIITALDLFLRIGLGQFEKILDHPQYLHKIINDNVSFKESEKLLYRIKSILTGYPPYASHGIGSLKVHEDCTISYDIAQVIRHRLAWDKKPEGGLTTDFGTPVQFSNEELAKIKTIQK